ncbi:HNH endonuclease [Yersinia phage fHe-Yen9-02]|nr:HNH endonuclease [Yersinia phage fHe-Yen9-02]
MAYRPRGGIAARSGSGGWGKPSTAQRLAGRTGIDRLRVGTNARMDRTSWAQLKADILRERGAFCEKCGKSTQSLILDHIVTHAAGGSNSKRNLMLVCESCDKKKLGTANKRGARLLHGK